MSLNDGLDERGERDMSERISDEALVECRITADGFSTRHPDANGWGDVAYAYISLLREVGRARAEPKRVKEGCKHETARMYEWVGQGACPICLTAEAGMKGEAIRTLEARVAALEALAPPDAALHNEILRRQRAEIEVLGWQSAAQRIGEEFVGAGPPAYYHMPWKDWLDWAIPKARNLRAAEVRAKALEAVVARLREVMPSPAELRNAACLLHEGTTRRELYQTADRIEAAEAAKEETC